MDDLLNDFITETNESLEVLDTELVKFEQEPDDTEILGNIFRLMHTIKGTCGFLGLPRLESVAHAGENVLGTFREGEIEVTPAAVTSILSCIDRIREVLAGIEEHGVEVEGDDSQLISVLNAMAAGEDLIPAEVDGKTSDAEFDCDAKTTQSPTVVMPTTAQLELVRQTYAIVEADVSGVMENFYERLFTVYPQLSDLFADDMADQRQSLMAIISNAIEEHRELEELVPTLVRIGLWQEDRVISPEDRDGVGETLVRALEDGLGDVFSSDVREAWLAVYGMIAETIMSGDRSLNESEPGTNEFGAPVAAELLAEVETALSSGVRPASDAEIMERIKEEAEGDGEAVELDLARAAEQHQSVADRFFKASEKEITEESADTETLLEQPALGRVAPSKPVPKELKNAESANAPKASKEAPVVQASIRVNVDVLEGLMTLVSELVLTRNQLLQMVRGVDDSEFVVPLQRLSHITTDLQEGVMKTRMQPIGNAWAKLPRIVRDLAVETGKKIDLVMNGAETELDRQVLELIKDPLTHMVRNSADHGLENLDDRLAAGKPETGTVTLDAYHEGGHIIIEIRDDGRGLNVEKIGKKCVERGLVTQAELESMDERQIQQFIFRPGFSTADKVTSVSGRGVGMDVVRTNIESIGGTVELQSTQGKGSVFTIKIPLTLAIVSALIVACGRERFAIPQISVLELVRTAANSEFTIETVSGSPLLRLRDRLLPLVSLRNLLGINDTSSLVDNNHHEELADGSHEDTAHGPTITSGEDYIIVAQVGSNSFGIIVDQVFDTEEIVVKPVAPILRDIPFYSGNTILGDGSVIMILDPNGISAAIGQGAAAAAPQEANDQLERQHDERTAFLVFKAGNRQPLAVPLGLIARLEEIDVNDIERAGSRYVVQYRGSLMPLIPVGSNQTIRESGNQAVIVFSDRDRSMGLLIDEIVDIVEDKLKIELNSGSSGMLGTAVINGATTDIIDANHFLSQACPDWFEHRPPEEEVEARKQRILLVDDSQFFRDLLVPHLMVSGYDMTTAQDPLEALKMRDDGFEFDFIITDIEMPHMSGFEFAENVRADGRWMNIPIIALSSRTTDADLDRGRVIGFHDYISKTQRAELISALTNAIKTYEEAA